MSRKKRPKISERQLWRKEMTRIRNVEKQKPQTNRYIEEEKILRQKYEEGIIGYDDYISILNRIS